MTSRICCSVLIFSIASLFMPLASAVSTEATKVLIADRLFDSKTGKLVSNPVVVIEKDKIISVQSGGTYPQGAQLINLKGMTLLPGLIEMHTHIDSDPTYGGYTDLQFSDRFWSMIAVPNAMKTLNAGFTSIRNVGSRDWNDVGLKQAIDEGKISGPRIIPSGKSFGATGGHCDSTYFPPSMEQKNRYNAAFVN